MKKKRILVTGAAGFIGFHLARRLEKRGDIVLGFDNFNEYYDSRLKRERVLHLQNIEVIEGDLFDFDCIKKHITEFQPTHIVNLAAQAGVRYSINHPREYLKSNVEGFFNVLEVCREFPNIKLIYASSSSVYGENEKVPFSESDTTDKIVSFYGITKKNNEMMAEVYSKLYDISVTGLRFFTVYGEWGRPDMAYFSFTKKILNGEPIQVYNHGQMSRDFTYIDDIVDGIVAAIDLGAKCEIFNLGNSHPETLSRFVEIIEQTLGKKAIKEELPMQQGDVTKTFADLTKSRENLNYNPKISLEVGIPKFISWYGKYFGVR